MWVYGNASRCHQMLGSAPGCSAVSEVNLASCSTACCRVRGSMSSSSVAHGLPCSPPLPEVAGAVQFAAPSACQLPPELHAWMLTGHYRRRAVVEELWSSIIIARVPGHAQGHPRNFRSCSMVAAEPLAPSGGMHDPCCSATHASHMPVAY